MEIKCFLLRWKTDSVSPSPGGRDRLLPQAGSCVQRDIPATATQTHFQGTKATAATATKLVRCVV